MGEYKNNNSDYNRKEKAPELQQFFLAEYAISKQKSGHLKDLHANFQACTTMRNQFLCSSISLLQVQFSPKAAFQKIKKSKQFKKTRQTQVKVASQL